MSVFGRCRNKAVMASHLFQNLGQPTEVAIRKMLGLPQVQDHSRGTGFGGEVVKIPEWMTNQRGMGQGYMIWKVGLRVRKMTGRLRISVFMSFHVCACVCLLFENQQSLLHWVFKGATWFKTDFFLWISWILLLIFYSLYYIKFSCDNKEQIQLLDIKRKVRLIPS